MISVTKIKAYETYLPFKLTSNCLLFDPQFKGVSSESLNFLPRQKVSLFERKKNWVNYSYNSFLV